MSISSQGAIARVAFVKFQRRPPGSAQTLIRSIFVGAPPGVFHEVHAGLESHQGLQTRLRIMSTFFYTPIGLRGIVWRYMNLSQIISRT
jgi:hypothetical protein